MFYILKKMRPGQGISLNPQAAIVFGFAKNRYAHIFSVLSPGYAKFIVLRAEATVLHILVKPLRT